MKLNAIRAACMKRNVFRIYNGNSGGYHQWIGNGMAYWPVTGIRLTEENIPDVFDIDGKKMARTHIGEASFGMDELLSAETAATDVPCVDGGVCLWHQGDLYRPVISPDGLLLLNVEHLKPADIEEGYLTFLARKWGRHTAIVCASGMMVAAVVMPEGEEKTAEIMDKAREILDVPVLRECAAAVSETNLSAGEPEVLARNSRASASEGCEASMPDGGAGRQVNMEEAG
jgi:hypothetical protein